MYFSVIVTVYKVEQYLEKCVESILSQTFGDFEVILVDDGSPDGCPALCDKYTIKDNRVRVIHQKNKGVANARNAGLSLSKGMYIIFVDGDDWLESSYLQCGHAILENVHADMILFACSQEYGNFSEKVYEPAEEGLYERALIQEKLYSTILMDVGMNHMSYTVWGKIFCRSLAEDCFSAVKENIYFGEDLLCVIQAYLRVQRIYISHDIKYFYRIHNQSASRRFQIEYYKQVDLVLKELRKFFDLPFDFPDDFERQIERYGAFMCFVLIVQAADDGRILWIGEIKRQIDQLLLQKCIQYAQFEKITPKTRITYILLKRRLILSSYVFLRICRSIKILFRCFGWYH